MASKEPRPYRFIYTMVIDLLEETSSGQHCTSTEESVSQIGTVLEYPDGFQVYLPQVHSDIQISRIFWKCSSKSNETKSVLSP